MGNYYENLLQEIVNDFSEDEKLFIKLTIKEKEKGFIVSIVEGEYVIGQWSSIKASKDELCRRVIMSLANEGLSTITKLGNG